MLASGAFPLSFGEEWLAVVPLLLFMVFCKWEKACSCSNWEYTINQDMYYLILLFLGGILAGHGLRHFRWLRRVEHTQTYTVWALLFVLGLSIGSNGDIMDNIVTLGGQALLISVCASLGSALFALALWHGWFKRRRNR